MWLATAGGMVVLAWRRKGTVSGLAAPDTASIDEAGAGKLLEVRDLTRFFYVTRGFPRPERVTVRAVDGVSFQVNRSEAFGIVGESGCGKSTVGRCLLRLIEPDGGSVRFAGTEVLRLRRRSLRLLRRRMQIIFQDPYASLNPRQRTGRTLAEPLLVHGLVARSNVADRIAELLAEVGLPLDAGRRFPHEFSGGQRQRIGIARALTVEPDLLVADEPVSALDVSIQAQILVLLRNIQERRGLSFVFISHDLGVVRWFCQRVAVMYLGRIVEQGAMPGLFDEPLHPYTRALRAASPVPDPRARVALSRIDGEVPSATAPPSGCHFHPRCPEVKSICRTDYPPLKDMGAGRLVACHAR